ncbi:MAG: hypothetical protein KH382_10500 [Clostridiales bacterium]|nr:hypothetical protein [Clostridiales bacterium]
MAEYDKKRLREALERLPVEKLKMLYDFWTAIRAGNPPPAMKEDDAAALEAIICNARLPPKEDRSGES